MALLVRLMEHPPKVVRARSNRDLTAGTEVLDISASPRHREIALLLEFNNRPKKLREASNGLVESHRIFALGINPFRIERVITKSK